MNLPQNSVDVLFLGASSVYAGFHPPRLYEQTGMRSFNLGSALQPPLVVYYNLRETLTRHKPKVVVIDFSFLHTHPDPAHERHEVRYLKGYVDLQSKDLKKQYLQDAKNLNPEFDPLPYLIPFYRFHTRWKNLTEKDFTDNSNYREMMLGGQFVYTYKPLQTTDRQTDEIYQTDEQSKQVYDRLIQLCKEQDIAIVSVLPWRNGTTVEQQLLHKNHAEENRILFVNYNQTEVETAVGLNPSTDFYDDKHVNILGARKMTDYIGAYILEQNLLTPEAYPEADELYQAWAAEYAAFPIQIADASDRK
jgi:hypothetical protein